MAAKYKFISGKQILSIFESNLDVRKYKFRREGNGVRHFIYNGVKYAAYAKNISHGGKGYESFVTRVQLPQNEGFDDLETDEVFILLGYCCNSDVFACWDVNVVRERLNRKSYVSFSAVTIYHQFVKVQSRPMNSVMVFGIVCSSLLTQSRL